MTKYIYKFLSPLINFNSSDSEIIISDDLIIRKPLEKHLKILNSLKQKWSNIGGLNRLLLIQIKKEAPESEPDIYLPEARKKIEKAITLLRLFKEESIGFNLIVQLYSDDPLPALSANALLHYMLWTPPQSILLKRIYELNKAEAKNFIQFFKEFDLPTLSLLKLAIRYFNKSFNEPYPYRDGFIDCIIALENLFLKNTDRELGYKLSLRIAYLLGQNENHRSELFEFVKEAYSLRSSIIHGEEKNKLKLLNDEYLLKTRAILRESIKYFIKKPDHWSGKELDKIILNGTFAPNLI